MTKLAVVLAKMFCRRGQPGLFLPVDALRGAAESIGATVSNLNKYEFVPHRVDHHQVDFTIGRTVIALVQCQSTTLQVGERPILSDFAPSQMCRQFLCQD